MGKHEGPEHGIRGNYHTHGKHAKPETREGISWNDANPMIAELCDIDVDRIEKSLVIVMTNDGKMAFGGNPDDANALLMLALIANSGDEGDDELVQFI